MSVHAFTSARSRLCTRSISRVNFSQQFSATIDPCLKRDVRGTVERIRRAHTDTLDDFRYTRLRPSTAINNNDGDADRLPAPTKLETFRLVELLAGTQGDPIRCRLHEVPATGTDPSRTITYEALSYCWGNSQHKTTIECNGKLLKIPSSLAAALGGLRHRDRPRHLWADAICIDQSDPLDKAMQVPHMRSIYSGAQRTLVWLGTIADSGAGAQPRISLGARACVRLSVPILGLADRRRRATRPTVRVLDRRTGKPRGMSVFSGSLYLSLAYMLRQSWFRRAWVVQEVAVAVGVTILFDHLEYEWDEVVAANRFLSGVKFPLAFLPSPHHLAAIDHERNLHASLASSLPGVLVRHQRCRATDHRDKIFAFAGLVSPASAARDVRVTYADADSPAVVFRELAMRLIVRDRSLDILSGLPTTSGAKVALPSWVPDWSNEPDYLDRSYTWRAGPGTLAGTETRDGLGDQTQCRFAATRRSRYEQPKISDDTLTVPGHLLGTVTYAGPSFAGVRLPTEVSRFRDITKGWMETLRSVMHARDVLIEWKRAVAPISASPYPRTGENMDVVFWQTVCAGEYATSPALQRAASIWERLMRGSRARNAVLTGVLRSFNLLGAFYSTLVFVLVLLKNDPIVEHRLQGRYVLNRRLVKLDDGNNQSVVVGLANCAVEVGDEVFLLQGSNVPLILRRKSGDAWRFVGDAYVHGYMNGEAWDETKCRPVRIT
ncbi:heterokaryon incompatibility protein-domain-containing protein [Apodospora peruviana]|uniref:Heterokaryon incompatibility protein-domain-containing protein n=1 Tax=Apodospora peruviana TaxID=516989 RepID=A0AAE0I673_9PEZI|nr:heterokaryon incompatibility protein-domain-containing protein [Apodospora peruviana]